MIKESINRENNKSKILDTIISNKKISRSDLSKKLNINKVTVSSIVRKLVNNHIVTEVGEGNASSSGGRKPVLLSVNFKSALVISIDIGYNYIDAAISFLDGIEIYRKQEIELVVNTENAFGILEKMIQDLLEHSPETPQGVIGVVIAVYGRVFNNKIVFSPYDDLVNSTFIKQLEEKYCFPILVENEAYLSALGEYTFSSKYESLITLSLHGSISTGIVKHGVLEKGSKGEVGRIGHMILFPNGRSCPCGNKGCLNQYCSTKCIYKELSILLGIKHMNSSILKRKYIENNQIVVDKIKEYCRLLSIAINNIAMLYSPDIIIINSQITKKIPDMLQFIRMNMNETFFSNLQIINSEIEWNPAILGGVAYGTQRFLNIERFKLTE